jgi:hypothetical protein
LGLLLSTQRLTGHVDPIMAMGLQPLIGAVPLALLSVLTEDVSSLTWSREFVLVLVVLSALVSSLALWLWFEALERAELRANAFTFLVPIFGIAIGAAFFWRAARGDTGCGRRAGADRDCASPTRRRFSRTAVISFPSAPRLIMEQIAGRGCS